MSTSDLKKPNVLILINDQQRALQDWPETWERKYLPSMTRLKQNGLTFTQASTVACACSASRASLLTGTYPTLHGVVNTLPSPDGVISGATNPGEMPIVLNEMRPTDPNLARILNAAGYRSVWKGKWHLSNPRNGGDKWTEEDIRYMRDAYGFDRWNPNDAGTSESDVKSLGAGAGGNDERYVTGKKRPDDDSPPGESILEFIESYKPSEGPFFLVVSLCNPHDVWVAPVFLNAAGYDMDEVDAATSDYGLSVPKTWNEDLSFKPAMQDAFRRMEMESDLHSIEESQGEYQGSTLDEPDARQRYVNFYAYLQTLTDRQIGKILDALDAKGLTDDTLIIRMADHGEMGLAHGLREKEFVAYDEAIRIPLIFSNPRLFDGPRVNDSPVCNIDVAPTLARLVGVYDHFAPYLQGYDLTPILDGEVESVQEFVHYMTDDSAAPNSNNQPGFIRAIRSTDWMYAVYYIVTSEAEGEDDDDDGDESSTGSWCKETSVGTTACYQYELYHLKTDRHQVNNLAGKEGFLDKQRELHELLNMTMQRYLTAPPGVLLPTPGLVGLMAKDKEDDSSSSVTNPVWPTPEEAILGSVAYRKYATSQSKEGEA